jgi:hypothetical protein
MDKKLIDLIGQFALAAGVKQMRAVHLLGLMTDGHDKVLYCWITGEKPTPKCLYEFIEKCIEDPNRNDLGDTEWWWKKTGLFTDVMGYLYGYDFANEQTFAPAIPRNITPGLLGEKTTISKIEPNDFGGINDKVWRWIEENSGGTGWIAQGRITKRFQNAAKAEEINKLLDDWVKGEKLEYQKYMPPVGRTSNLYRIKKPATDGEKS